MKCGDWTCAECYPRRTFYGSAVLTGAALYAVLRVVGLNL